VRGLKAKAIKRALAELSQRGMIPEVVSAVEHGLKRSVKGLATDGVPGIARDLAARAVVRRLVRLSDRYGKVQAGA